MTGRADGEQGNWEMSKPLLVQVLMSFIKLHSKTTIAMEMNVGYY